METSSMDTGSLKDLIKEKMHNSYIEKFIKTPILNEDKLFILTSILNNTELPDYKKKNYIISTMLVQMALDTHDLVPRTNDLEHSNIDQITKQLSVLAGDYYSGLYYLILSEIEDVEMVHILASAIKDINEHKMQLYYRDIDSFETFISIVKRIESLLYIRVAEFAGESTISDIAAGWLLTKKMIKERKHMMHASSSTLFSIWYKQNSSSDRPTTTRAVETLIDKEMIGIESRITHFPKHLEEVKSQIKDTLHEFSCENRSIAEEG